MLRLQNEWETAQASRDRAAIYGYLAAVFELVACWDREGKAVKRANRALHLRGYSSLREPEPFAAVIFCTADPDKVDDRTRSKWSRVLRYAAEYKDPEEPLDHFIVRSGRYQQMCRPVSPASWAIQITLRSFSGVGLRY